MKHSFETKSLLNCIPKDYVTSVETTNSRVSLSYPGWDVLKIGTLRHSRNFL